VFADTYEEYREHLIKDAVLVVEGDVSLDEYSGGLKMVTRKIFSIAQARENYARLVSVQIHQSRIDAAFSERLKTILDPFRDGACKVRIDYQREGAKAKLYLGDDWRIAPRPELIKQLEQLCGERSLTVFYR